MNIQKPKIIGISFIFNLVKKVLLILILISKLYKNIIDFTIISANIYCITNKLKKAQVFTIFIKDSKF